MIKIYHNPRCRKSREGLAIVEASKKPFEVILYLENQLSVEELQEVIKQLDIEPKALVRTQEAIWKSDYKGKELKDTQILKALSENPKLIERPVVLYQGKGVIGRPAEKIIQLLGS